MLTLGILSLISATLWLTVIMEEEKRPLCRLLRRQTRSSVPNTPSKVPPLPQSPKPQLTRFISDTTQHTLEHIYDSFLPPSQPEAPPTPFPSLNVDVGIGLFDPGEFDEVDVAFMNEEELKEYMVGYIFGDRAGDTMTHGDGDVDMGGEEEDCVIDVRDDYNCEEHQCQSEPELILESSGNADLVDDVQVQRTFPFHYPSSL